MMGLIYAAIYAFFAVVAMAILALKLWLVGSVITSGVKAISDSCDQTYPVEAVVSANWFCPSNKENK